MARRVLVTGAAGFLGRHLCEYLRSTGEDLTITGVDVQTAGSVTCADFVSADLCDAQLVREVVRRANPDVVVHLAGLFGADDAVATFQTNVLATLALLEAVRHGAPHATFVTTGSAAEYGHVPAEQLPVTEAYPCAPVTIYGFSKLSATQAALYYHRVHGLATMVVRPFQLLGRGVTTRLAPGAFAEQIRRASRSGQPTIAVGNLASARDFLDVRDAAAGVWALCQEPAPGEVFNLCSGHATKIGELLDAMIAASGAQIRVEVDPQRLRGAADVSVIYGSFDKLRRHCGWTPRCTFSESIRALVG